MKRNIIAFVTLLTLVAAPFAFAQCPPEYLVNVGESACIHVCAGEMVNVNLQGNNFWTIGIFSVCNGCFCVTYAGEQNDAQLTPILIFNAGCQNPPSCIETCPPVIVPPLVLGADPFYPLDYYGENNCLFVYMHFVHYLAADLVSFSALPGNGEVTLNWETASESNNDHFEIERGSAVVASVEATNLATGGEYTYTDRGLTNDVEYVYTLVAVDVNGQRSALKTINATPVDNSNVLVTSYALYQNYPNPFNPETSIAFDLVENGHVSLSIYNVLGEQLTTLVDGQMTSGRHSVVFNGANLASGVYLYKLNVNGFTDTRKLVLLK
jgi:hypothetical protein